MGMPFNRDKLLPSVKEKAAKFNLDFRLVDAIVQTESAYNIYAIRYEAKSTHHVIPEKFARINFTTVATEEQLQKFSWGLCQIMGSTARWLGYQGPLPYLCDIDTNLQWACRYLAKLRDDHGGVVEQIIASYNAGSVRRDSAGAFVNQGYVDKVLNAYKAG